MPKQGRMHATPTGFCDFDLNEKIIFDNDSKTKRVYPYKRTIIEVKTTPAREVSFTKAWHQAGMEFQLNK